MVLAGLDPARTTSYLRKVLPLRFDLIVVIGHWNR
jgi:hypothetical protein